MFILHITSTVFAQATLTNIPTGQFYKNDAFNFDITFPNSWSIKERQGKPSFFILSAYSPTHFPLITIISGPHEEVKPNNVAADKQKKNSNFEFKVEGQGEAIIAGKEAKWALSSFTDHASLNTYTFFYSLKTDQNDYVITMQGNYTEYESDRTIFDKVISTLYILD